MMRWQKLDHRFVRHLPETLEPGVFYISVEYATASHLCCCGCGEEVVTPFSPVGWRMTFDGETVSLWPSVGNWSLRCRSHYIIERGNVLVAAPWSDEQVEAERRRDRAAKDHHFGTPAVAGPAPQAPAEQPATGAAAGWWARLWRWLFASSKG
jgi:hypothetical protein